LFCSQCGAELPIAARFCPGCGAAAPTTGEGRDAAAASGGTGALRFDLRRWTLGDLVVAAATLVAFLALFLPWYSWFDSFSSTSYSESVLSGHAWTYLVLLVDLALLAYLAGRALSVRVRLPLPHHQAVALATGFNALLLLIAFVAVPGATSWSFGAYLGLLAGLAALAGNARALRRAPGALRPAARAATATGHCPACHAPRGSGDVCASCGAPLDAPG